MTDHLDPVLLAKWLGGELSPSERQVVSNWGAVDPARTAWLDEVRELWGRAGEVAERRIAAGDVAEQARWNAIQQAIETRRASVTLPRERPRYAINFPLVRQQASRRRWAAIAAAAALVVGAGALARRVFPWMPAVGVPREAGRMITVSTARGERRVVTLSDGTHVVLAPGSTLRWSSSYGAGERRVDLDGEAVFSVVHDATRPFSVRTPHAIVRDLGTRFDVRAYSADATADVVVAEGVVAVVPSTAVAASRAGRADSLVLHRGDRVVVGVDSVVVSHDVAVDGFLAWTTGRLVIRDLPVREVVARLNRWYDIEIRYPSGAFDKRTLSASFGEEGSGAEAAQVVAAILGVRMSRSGNVYTLQAQ